MNWRKIDWKNFSLLEVIRGCSNSLLSTVNIGSPKVKELAEYRLGICQQCDLLTENGVCHRDWTDKDDVIIEEIVTKKYSNHLKNSANPEIDYQNYKALEEKIYIRNEKHHIVVDNKEYLGCGCIIKCKIFNPLSSCPALKWEMVDQNQLK